MNNTNKNIKNLGTTNSATLKNSLMNLLNDQKDDDFILNTFKKIILLVLYIPKKIARFLRKKNLTSFYHRNHKNIENLLNLVDDDISREVIESQIDLIINYDYSGQENFLRKSGRIEKHTKLYDPEHYFSKDIMKLSDHEGFINCGSFTGDTVEDFVKRTNGKFNHIFAFEPSKVNFIALSATVKKLGLSPLAITCYQKGVYSENITLHFNINTIDGGASTITEGGEDIIDGVALDSFLAIEQKNQITFINMDIEGAEFDALHGMQEIIRKNKPKLAISVYHNPEHFWTIPFFIKSLNPDYKIYFRQHSISKSETVCYAV